MTRNDKGTSLTKFLQAIERRYAPRLQRLTCLLERTQSALDPLGDPVATDYGAHRWLRSRREEVYSDWLAWILGQCSGAEVLPILGIPSSTLNVSTDVLQGMPDVQREQVVLGDDESAGRIDITVRLRNDVIIAVEIKRLISPDVAHTDKHRLYTQWLAKCPETIQKAVLIARAGAASSYKGFTLCPWTSVCCQLRQLAVTKIRAKNIPLAAMTLAFVGAVEQNILSLRRTGSIVTRTRLIEHLETFLAGDRKGGTTMGQKQDPGEQDNPSGLSEYVQAKHAIRDLEAELQTECRSVLEEHLAQLGDAMKKSLKVKAIEAYVYEDKGNPLYVWCGVKLPIDKVATLYMAYLLEEDGPCSAGVTVVLTDKKNADKQWRQCQIPENVECERWYPGGITFLAAIRKAPTISPREQFADLLEAWVGVWRQGDRSILD